MNFTKMHGAGNDYIYVNAFKETITDPIALAKKVSHRHFGIGGDGLILIKPHASAAAEMEMYNADGSSSEMCGNGLRCVAKYVFDYKICTDTEFNLATGAGIKKVNVSRQENGVASQITIDMGAPILVGKEIPTTWESNTVINQEISVLDQTFHATCISMGNPHCIIYVDDVKNFPVEKYGSALENHARFPNRVNIEFIEIISESEVIQRTWERGSGETWACGTGASAVCAAGVLTGKTAKDLLIHLTGGDLQLNWKGHGSSVVMTGPAAEVFSGSIEE
jgi:diaminopimelate epimerase